MKKIEMFIRPDKLEDVKEGFDALKINGLSISEVMGCGKQKGWKEYVRGSEVDYKFLKKIKIETVVTDDQLENVINTVCEKAQTGQVGDGKIFVYDVIDAIRIRTRERGEKAIK
ncbi:MAG: P-II family nitrogen regulator [Saccharofermentanales bacterium]